METWRHGDVTLDDKCPVFSSQLRIRRISKTQCLLGNLLPCCLASYIIVSNGPAPLGLQWGDCFRWLAELPGFFPDEVCAVLSSVPVSRNDLRCPVASTGGPHPSYSDSSSRVTELNAETDTYKLQLIFTPANSSMSPMSLNYSKLSCFNCGKMSWFSIMINPKTNVKRCQNNVL